MKDFLKKIYWNLPINNVLKEKISRIRYEHILSKEAKEDEQKDIQITSDFKNLSAYTKYVLKSYSRKSEFYKKYKENKPQKKEVCLVAYYLTQFHPNPQNDTWWGKGVTEWNNVNQAVPQFVGHYQPRKPGELGYYDLRMADTFKKQIEIAKNYGIGAFCFYYYWFDNGQRLLDLPLNLFLKDKSLDMPFFYCWANENWTKRFSGTNSDILMGITSSPENYKEFIESVIQDLTDERYYCIDNKPVLSIYRPSLIPSPEKVIVYWRNRVLKETGRNLYLIAVQERDVTYDWRSVGFDAETEFQPKQIQHNCLNITKKVNPVRKDFSGVVYDYKDLVENKKYKIEPNLSKPVYPAVMPMWDNTARRNHRGLIFHGSTPALYQRWLEDAIRSVKANNELATPMVFINAWNEWGEGAYLEPDDQYGFAYLNSTYEALKNE